MLKKLRVIIAIIILTVISFYFIDFTGLLSDRVHLLAKIQLIPALLAVNLGVLLFLILLTFLFGRVYCSTLCPMGIFQDVVSWFSKLNKKKRKTGYKHSKAKNILRYGILGACVLALLLHFIPVLSLIEPYSAYSRIITHLLKPAVVAGNNALASYSAEAGTFYFTTHPVWTQSIAAFATALVTFLIITFLAWKFGRTYCNTICPAGTLLGSISKYSLFKVQINDDSCGSCGLCERKCKASCINAKEKSIDHSRCVNCFNCLSSCKKNAISYAYTPAKRAVKKAEKQADSSRRQFLVTTAVTSIAIPHAFAKGKKDRVVALATNQKAYKKETPLSPPGSRSHKHFSQHCTSCHLCINRCPKQILMPAMLQYGLGGIMQPTLKFEENFCDFNCTVCSDVCPNGAIKPLSVEQKQHTQVGYAVYVTENCIVNTQQIKCGACSRKCPTQAISMVPNENGLSTPSVDTGKCIGCGACEYICPVLPYRGIYVEGKAVHTLVN